MEWFSSNSSAITGITSICTLFVWLFYAQLLYLNFKRQRQPKVIINRGFGRSPDSRCLISNMSPEPIFIEHIIAVLHTDRGYFSHDLIDFEEGDGESEEKARQLIEMTRQGPMMSGSYNHIGSFSEIINRVLRSHQISADGVRASDGTTILAIELRIVAVYGSEDAPIGAARVFELTTTSDDVSLVPTSLETKRYASILKRRKVRNWVRELNG